MFVLKKGIITKSIEKTCPMVMAVISDIFYIVQ